MTDKRTPLDDVAGLVEDGMTIGIGGWGSRRKPLALVRAIVRSRVRDLTVVSFGGPDVGMLCASGQARRVVHGFVSLDSIAIDPHFAARRQAGTIDSVELDEAMLVAGLRAAGRRLSFEVTRSGLGSDAVTRSDAIRTIVSPYDDREELVAMPAVPLDVALVHVETADARGNAQCSGPEVFFDDLFAHAATRTIMSAERIVETKDFASSGPIVFNRTMVQHVVAAPGGAGFTDFAPSYPRDELLQRVYADALGDKWPCFRAEFINVNEQEYLSAVGRLHAGKGSDA